MSSKSKKSAATSSSATSASGSFSVSGVASPQMASTPVQAGAAAAKGKRPGTPLSPTRQSRIQEKQELQSLNDRLANYIDRVRHLETENARLSREVHCSTETVTREVSGLKGMYEHELGDARRLLDDTAKEKAKLEIDIKRLYDDNDDLRTRLEKKTKEHAAADNAARLFESRVSELNSKYNTAIAERKKAQDENQELGKEVNALRKQLADTRKIQEEETLCRIDLENTLQSMKEELSFKDQIYQQELTESRSRKQVEITEIDGRLAQQYEMKLQQSLQELRAQQEANVKANRDELEHRYESKLKSLQDAANRNSSATTLAVNELRSARIQVDALNVRITELENSNGSLNLRHRELEKELQGERARHAEDLAQMEEELSRIRNEMSDQLREYNALMDIKITLDLEIATYRTLLEGEEDRLNLSCEAPKSGRGSSARRTPIKAVRKRVLLEESEEQSVEDFAINNFAKGDIEISDACIEGKYVKIYNKGKKDVSLSGWQIVRRAGSLEIPFKFHRSAKIEPNATVTVWSADAGHDHEPPLHLVMKGQKWFVDNKMSTVVLNSTQEEVAGSVREKRQISSSQRYKESHKVPRGDGDEKCSIM